MNGGVYRLSSGQWPDLEAVHSTYHRLTAGLPTWVEQSKDTCSWSNSSFPTIVYSGSIISYLSLSFIFIFLCQHIFIFIYTVHAGCLYVADTLSTATIADTQASVKAPVSQACYDLERDEYKCPDCKKRTCSNDEAALECEFCEHSTDCAIFFTRIFLI